MDIGAHINTKREQLLLRITFILFAIIFCLISLVNHYQFRTAALDLGIFNNALYSFSHFKANHFTLDLPASNMNFMGDHFSPITYLYTPFYYLFGSYTVLLIQIASILFGGLGIYKYCKYKFPDSYLPLIITLQFFGIWGIYSALSFDFHNNVAAAMLVPWLIYYYEKQNKNAFLLFFALILISKENMALWMVFIMAGLMLKRGLKNYKSFLRFEIPLFFFAALYFVVVVSYIMPSLENTATNYQLEKYGNMGHSLPDIIATMLHHPVQTLSLFFVNQTADASLNSVKTELHCMVLASGGLALIYRPYYLVMLLPIYVQKLFTDNVGIWGINGQYSIEYVPILSLALADSIVTFKSAKLRYAICTVFTICTYIANIHSMDHRETPYYNSQNTKFYVADHYESGLNLSEIYAALKLIPDNAAVTASCNITPHLSNREKIYAFPNVKDADYIVLFDTDTRGTYPISPEEYIKLRDGYKNSGAFSTIYDANHLLILKRK